MFLRPSSSVTSVAMNTVSLVLPKCYSPQKSAMEPRYCVCVCVCVHVCACVCVGTGHTHPNYSICTHKYTHAHTYTHMHTHMHTHKHTHIHTCTHINTHIYTHAHTYIRIHCTCRVQSSSVSSHSRPLLSPTKKGTRVRGAGFKVDRLGHN